MIVGTNAEFPPFSYIENKAIVGFDIDVAKEVAQRLGKTIQIKDMPFDALIPDIALGHVDFVAAGMSYTEERAKRASFTKSYFEDPLMIFSKRPLSFDKLKGKKVVVVQGFTADLLMSSQKNIDLIRLHSRLLFRNARRCAIPYDPHRGCGRHLRSGRPSQKNEAAGRNSNGIGRHGGRWLDGEIEDQMEAPMIDLPLIWEALPSLLQGAALSLQITLLAASIGLTLGSILGLAETMQSRSIRFSIGAYVALFRGTPMLVQILFLYYVLPQFGIAIDPFWSASLAIGLNSAAYVSQIIRGGIKGVSVGQIEAACTLGFSSIQTMRYIVFPQALRISLPSLGNELITLVKDSSLASIIGVMELSKEASIIRSRTYDAFSILLAVAAIYLLLTAAIGFCLKKYEKSHV